MSAFDPLPTDWPGCVRHSKASAADTPVCLAANAGSICLHTFYVLEPHDGTQMYTVTQESWLASKASACATLEEALEVANGKIAEKAPGTRVTLKNNLTGQVL
jgi:hypothetical protein